MYGFWLLLLFVLLPGAVGAALSYVFSRAERPSNKLLALGAALGVAVGLVLAVFLVRI
jgi:hypothetical protein